MVCLVLLCINCFLELKDIALAVRTLRPGDYFTNLWNYIDLGHFLLMWAAWLLWVLYVDTASRFRMESSYQVLADPASDLRFFATVGEQEKAFLDFVAAVAERCDRLAQYTAISGVSVLVFLFRIIKNLDFQERMGLVSRTIFTAVPDLIHFSVLFAVVYFGFTVVGHVMFGHLFEPMSTLQGAATELFFWLVGYDPPSFWEAMSHAAPPWAFQTFVWSYLVIVSFILFNVLLAIFIDTYCEIKGQQDPEVCVRVRQRAAHACLAYLQHLSDMTTCTHIHAHTHS